MLMVVQRFTLEYTIMPRKSKATQAGKTFRTVSGEFPGVSHYKDRHGKLRWRYRSKGFTTNLGTEYGSPEFIRRYTAAVRGERLTTAGEASQRTHQAPQGSLSHVIQSWYRTPEFTRLAKSTQRHYRQIAERLREQHGHRPVAGLSRQVVKSLMAQKADTPAAANHVLRILRLVLEHAMEMELIESNPARTVKKYATTNPDGYHTWSEDEINEFFSHWGEGTPADLAVSLMLYTGASRADAVQLGPQNVKGGRIQYRRQKMKHRDGVLVDIPIHPELARRLDRLPPDQSTFLQTDQGKARTAAGLGNVMRKWCTAAGLEGCTAHGLRKACARRLAEAGASPHEIMAVTGHKTLAEVERYTSKVGRAGLADRAMGR